MVSSSTKTKIILFAKLVVIIIIAWIGVDIFLPVYFDVMGMVDTNARRLTILMIKVAIPVVTLVLVSIFGTPKAWNNQGETLFNKGRYEKAIKSYDKATTTNQIIPPNMARYFLETSQAIPQKQ